MDFIEYVELLRRRWLTLLICLILGGAVGYGWAATTTPTYQATSKVFVSVSSGDTVDDLVRGSTFTQNLVQSYTQLATTPAVLDPVIEELQLDRSASDLAKSIEASTPLNTVIIEISVTDTSPALAARIANAVADNLPVEVDRLSSSEGGVADAAVQVRTIADATEPKASIAPNTALRTAMGLVVGLLVGVGMVILRRLTDTRVHDENDLTAIMDEPVLGLIPLWDGDAADSISMIRQPQGPRSESYRRLRTNLEFVRRGGGEATAIVITSSMPHEGKTTTAVNLAVALAEQGDRVLLIDADMRRPFVAVMTGLEGTVGLSSVLIGKVPLEDAVQKWGNTPLEVLTSGDIPPNPLHLIDSQAMLDLVQTARDEYDFVVVDSPPLLSVVDAAVLSRQCDGPLIVAAANRSKRKQLAASRDALAVAGVAPIGLVLTRAPHDGTSDYRDYAIVVPDETSIRRRIARFGRSLRLRVRSR